LCWQTIFNWKAFFKFYLKIKRKNTSFVLILFTQLVGPWFKQTFKYIYLNNKNCHFLTGLFFTLTQMWSFSESKKSCHYHVNFLISIINTGKHWRRRTVKKKKFQYFFCCLVHVRQQRNKNRELFIWFRFRSAL
jgi:hypothetical protein